MRVLLDTHILIAIARNELATRFPSVDSLLTSAHSESFASVASLWEIAIKSRLGKLDPGAPLDQLASIFESYGFAVLDITRHHAVAFVEPEPFTRDPFDRMLLAQCKVEGMRLVTLDRALVNHPLSSPA